MGLSVKLSKYLSKKSLFKESQSSINEFYNKYSEIYSDEIRDIVHSVNKKLSTSGGLKI